jgi:hypothetical protein
MNRNLRGSDPVRIPISSGVLVVRNESDSII